MKTYLSYASTGIVLSNILLYVFVDLIGISKAVAPFINLLITVPLNFVLNKSWAFRKEKKKENEEQQQTELEKEQS